MSTGDQFRLLFPGQGCFQTSDVPLSRLVPLVIAIAGGQEPPFSRPGCRDLSVDLIPVHREKVSLPENFVL